MADYATQAYAERLAELIMELQDRVAKLQHKVYTLEDNLRNVRYTAESADRKADDAKADAQRASRGW